MKAITIGFLSLLVLVGSTAATVSFISGKRLSEFGFSPLVQDQTSWVAVCGLALMMFFGIFASHAFEQVRSPHASILHIGSVIRGMVSGKPFLMSVILSPLVFNAIIIAVGENPTRISDYLLAFQNGFFWQTVMSKRT